MIRPTVRTFAEALEATAHLEPAARIVNVCADVQIYDVVHGPSEERYAQLVAWVAKQLAPRGDR